MSIPDMKLATGATMPAIGLGTWMLEGEQCVDAVRTALDIGYRHIDTAMAYMNQREVGAAIKESGVPRKELFITTKIWRSELRYDDALAACEGCLYELGTDRIDLLLIHWPNRDIPIEETLRAFKRLQDEGKVRAVGVSNFTIRHLEQAIAAADKLGLKIAADQVEFHPFLHQKELLKFCKQHNIQLVAYSPLARGRVVKDKKIAEIAKRHGKTPGQVALRWIMDKGVTVIPKASSEEHLRENTELGFTLTKEETALLDDMPQQRIVAPGFSEF